MIKLIFDLQLAEWKIRYLFNYEDLIADEEGIRGRLLYP